MNTISAEHVSKTFTVRRKKNESFLSYLLSVLIKKERGQKLQVLSDVCLRASAGEVVGIIGYNGSGKSTILRIIAGIYTADSGQVKTKGKMVYISGFGQGLKDRLTMRDNIFLLGSLLGLSRNDVVEKFQTIVDFSGLAEYLDTKIYQFSSGMLIRLTFSISIHCLNHHDPDILLIDEVLSAGGDITFQEQASAKMEEFIKRGATVLMVSHNLDEIKKYCSRVIWFEKGKVKTEGKPEEIIEAYTAQSRSRLNKK